MKTIKVLTVKQPWAFLLVAGIKDVENRNCPTNYRGELFIHASVEKSFDWDALIWLMEQKQMGALWAVVRHFGLILNDKPEKSTITKHHDEFGAILGSVNLDCCIQNPPSSWEIPSLSLSSSWAMPDSKFYWFVSNAKPIQPIPARGKLSIWNYDMEEES